MKLFQVKNRFNHSEISFMALIDVISYDNSEGDLREIYDDLIKKRGKLAAVHTIQSLNPGSIVHHMNLYMHIMFGKSPLKRYQREMIAVVVSAANRCPYCIIHHGAALNHFWKDRERVQRLSADFTSAGLDIADEALAAYSYSLTATPEKHPSSQLINNMKDAGLTDREILDASLVVAYFNFVNRMVSGLDVDIEADQGEGYYYD